MSLCVFSPESFVQIQDNRIFTYPWKEPLIDAAGSRIAAA